MSDARTLDSDGDHVMTEIASFADMRRAIGDDYDNYRRDWTKPGFRALAIHRFGVWARDRRRATLAEKVIARFLDVLYIIGHRYIRNHHGIELHRSAHIGRGVKFPHNGGVVIHHYASIGDGCVLQHGVTLGSAGRGVTREEAPRLENNVGVGPGAVILGRVTIGAGARIGPNVVIYTDIPAGATVVANSPRVIFAPPTKRRRSAAQSSQAGPEQDSSNQPD